MQRFSTAKVLGCATLTSMTVLFLTACGGGGGSASGSNGASTDPVVTPGNLVTTVATPTYAADSEEMKAFQYLNDERQRCGFGLLAQSTKLDAAAKAHATWNLINNQYSHDEDASLFPRGFTGETISKRLTYQGYASKSYSGVYNLGEVMAIDATLTKNGLGQNFMRGLLNAPFHMRILMSDFSDIGIAVQSPADIGLASGNTLLVADLAYSMATGRQNPASDFVQTYPCEGSTGVDYELLGELPNPVPGRDLAANPLGVSVLVRVAPGQSLTVTSASMKETATGASVELRPMVGGANGVADTIDNAYNASHGYIAANTAMKPNTRYTMSITGTNNGAAFNKTFNFTTGQ